MLSTFNNSDFWFNTGWNALMDGLEVPFRETTEQDNTITYRYNAAGLLPKDIEITQETRGLTHTITVKTPSKILKKILAYGYDPETGEAELENGVLSLSFRKQEWAKPKSIVVRQKSQS